MNLQTATPAEVDTVLAEIMERTSDVQWADYRLADEADTIELRNEQRIKGTYRGYYRQEDDDRRLARIDQERSVLAAQIAELLAEAAPYHDEFTRRGGWTRAWLVDNNNGHVHNSQLCWTCNARTRFGWLPQVSGQTEAEAVAEFGAILCTVCFPSAPSEWTDRHDDSVCKGSGSFVDRSLPSRTGYYTGNWATCTECGERVTISKTGKLRKHKKA